MQPSNMDTNGTEESEVSLVVLGVEREIQECPYRGFCCIHTYMSSTCMNYLAKPCRAYH